MGIVSRLLDVKSQGLGFIRLNFQIIQFFYLSRIRTELISNLTKNLKTKQKT